VAQIIGGQKTEGDRALGEFARGRMKEPAVACRAEPLRQPAARPRREIPTAPSAACDYRGRHGALSLAAAINFAASPIARTGSSATAATALASV
jgi:hypothetical protein